MLLDREMSSASCSSVRGTRAEAPGCGRLAIGQRIKSIVGLDCARHMEIKNSWVVKDTESRAFFGSQGNTQPLQPTTEQSEALTTALVALARAQAPDEELRRLSLSRPWTAIC